MTGPSILGPDEPDEPTGDPDEPEVDVIRIDLAEVRRMAERSDMPDDLRAAIEGLCSVVTTLTGHVEQVQRVEEDCHNLLMSASRYMACLIYLYGDDGEVWVPEDVLAAAPLDPTVMRHEPLSRPGAVFRINPAEWANVPRPRQ